jgi:hypothetical protein
MYIKDNYNETLESKNYQEVSNFMDKCENCPKLAGGCDYLGWLDDRLEELDGELKYCSQCGTRILLSDGELSYQDNNTYCEGCWIQHEVNLRGLN